MKKNKKETKDHGKLVKDRKDLIRKDMRKKKKNTNKDLIKKSRKKAHVS